MADRFLLPAVFVFGEFSVVANQRATIPPYGLWRFDWRGALITPPGKCALGCDFRNAKAFGGKSCRCEKWKKWIQIHRVARCFQL